MWSGIRQLLRPIPNIRSPVRECRVSVVGAASELGQAVSLLLRAEAGVSQLSVHDGTSAAAALYVDLSHIPMHSQLKGYTGDDTLIKALGDADLVLATQSVLPPGGLDKVDQLAEHKIFIQKFAEAIAKIRPMPFVGIATEPINVFVPMAAEIIKYYGGEFNPRKLFGISGVDSLRAQVMYAEAVGESAGACSVPVICGHSPSTIVPLFSHAEPARQLDAARVQTLTERVRRATDYMAAAKKGAPPTLSAAHSVLHFTRAIADALGGKKTPKIHAFIENNDFGTSYFAGRVAVTEDGAGDMDRFHDLRTDELELLEHSIAQLRDEVMWGKKILELA